MISEIGRWSTMSSLPHPPARAEVVVSLRHLFAGDYGHLALDRLALQEGIAAMGRMSSSGT